MPIIRVVLCIKLLVLALYISKVWPYLYYQEIYILLRCLKCNWIAERELSTNEKEIPACINYIIAGNCIFLCIVERSRWSHENCVCSAPTFSMSGSLYTLASLRPLNQTFLYESIFMKGSAINSEIQLLYLCFWENS